MSFGGSVAKILGLMFATEPVQMPVTKPMIPARGFHNDGLGRIGSEKFDQGC